MNPSNSARQDVYRILSELEELGLVERVVATPTKFRPTPIKNALSILFQRRHDENSELQKKANEIFSSSKNWNRHPIAQIDEPRFEIRNVYPNDPRVKAAFMSAKTTIRLLEKEIAWSNMFSFLGEITHALKRGVRVKIITEITSKRVQTPKFWATLKQEPLFQARYLPTFSAANLLIIDTREVAIWEVPTSRTTHKLGITKALWSNHRGLVELASNYFEVTWNTASDLNRSG